MGKILYYGVTRTCLILVSMGLAASALSAQQDGQANGRRSTHGTKAIKALAIEQPLTVDGVLDEAAWREAPVSGGFVQKDPQEGAPSTEKTEFRIAYTPRTLYIAIIAYDSDPHGILANERRRDGDLSNDDYITVVLDTFHDHRNSYKFTTNALGTQADALVTDEGNNTNENWDEKWEVGAHVTETGWVAEFGIPFKTVRVPETQDGMTWGLDIQRFIRRKNESTSWVNYHRGFDIANVSQAGHLTGIESIETGLRLRIKPYLLGGFSQHVRKLPPATLATQDFRTVTQDASNVGIEVMKYRITPSLTADFTYRTDFAQTEVDNQQINTDRFPLFFPEKREFFQEGSGIFEFGVYEDENRGAVSKLFHSRQIGLSPRRLPIPIVAGGRITGKLHGFSVGMLNMQTESFAPENILASNYTVGRVKRDVLGRSSIGAFFLNREMGNSDDHNRVAGADANFVFYRYLQVGGFFAKSASPRPEGVPKGGDWISAALLRWDSDTFNIETSWHSVGTHFRDDLGFIPRPNQRRISPQIAIRPRIDGKYIRQLIFRGRVDYTMNSNNHLETRIGHTAFEINFQDGGVFGWVPHTRFDTFTTPFDFRRGLVRIPVGSYSWWNNGLRYSLSPRRRISGQIINWAWHIGYYKGGNLHDISFNPRVRITDQLSAQVGYSISKYSFPVAFCVDQSQPTCRFTDHLVNARINYNFNNNWLTSTIIQYNNADHVWGYNLRLNYIFRPGDDFFLIYNEGRQIEGQQHFALAGEKDRSLQAKLTYSFDF